MSICLNSECRGFCYSNGKKAVPSPVEGTSEKVYVVYCECCGNGYGVGYSLEDLNKSGPHTWVFKPTGAPVCGYNGNESKGLTILPKQN